MMVAHDLDLEHSANVTHYIIANDNRSPSSANELISCLEAFQLNFLTYGVLHLLNMIVSELHQIYLIQYIPTMKYIGNNRKQVQVQKFLLTMIIMKDKSKGRE